MRTRPHQKMASSIIDRHIIIPSETKTDDEYTCVAYYDYQMKNSKKIKEIEKQEELKLKQLLELQQAGLNNSKRLDSVDIATVEDDDDYDEYTYESEFVEVEVKDNDIDLDSTAAPPPLPAYRATTSPMITTTTAESATPKASSYNPNPPMMLPSYPVVLARAPPPLAAPPVAPTENFIPNANPNMFSPSKQRAANSAGLSELSKQLRILQAKSESQTVDMQRLERQLRILADLQGISVNDLRKALEDACASEAFGELQNRVSKLKYDLEAANLAKQAELRKDAAAPRIANLELRVGELEEVEQKQSKEIRDLYDELRHERAKATRYESENQQLKGALQNMIVRAQSETARAAQIESDYQNQIQELRERQSSLIQEQAKRSLNSAGASDDTSVISTEMAAEYEQMVQLLRKKDDELREAKTKLREEETQRADKVKESEEKSGQVQMDMKVEMDKLALTVKELEDADGQNGLRLAQFKARFTVQNERIVDMDQQLDSLYTAFDMLKQEFDSENVRHAAMRSNLKDADAEIARQTIKNMQNENNNTDGQSHDRASSAAAESAISSAGFSNFSPMGDGSVASTMPSVPTQVDASSPYGRSSRPTIATVAPVSPVTPVTTRAHHGGTSDYDNTPTSYATAQAFHPPPERTPSTWDILLPNEQRNQQFATGAVDQQRQQHNHYQELQRQKMHQLHQQQHQYLEQNSPPLIIGNLIVENKSMIIKWKTKPSKIYFRGEGYQWDVGDKMSFPLRFGISKVEFNPNYPLSFAVHLDPSSAIAPVIRAAAQNEADYHRWMAVLYKVTSGEKYEGGSAETVVISPRPPSTSSSPSSRRMQPFRRNKSTGSRRPSTNINNSNDNSRFSYLLSGPAGSSQSASSHSNHGPTPSRAEEQEIDDDLQRVLERSKYET